MESEIEDLKQQVGQLKEMTQETNRMMRTMRRSQRYRTIFSIVWWLVVVGGSSVAYYYYVQPYVDQIIHSYGSFQGMMDEIRKIIAQFGSSTHQ